jgi:hypothetical protein
MVWLFEVAIFLIGISMITYPNFTKNAITYTPYKMEFVQMDEMNQKTPGKGFHSYIFKVIRNLYTFLINNNLKMQIFLLAILIHFQ